MQLDYVQCVGTEARLADCPSGAVSCPTHAYDAGVRCSVQTSKILQPVRNSVMLLTYFFHVRL